jgi:tetratricopeptide (TPR) repeat protein
LEERKKEIYKRIFDSLPEGYAYELIYFFFSGKVRSDKNDVLLTPNSILQCPQLQKDDIFNEFYPNGITLAQAVDFTEFKEGSLSVYVVAKGYEGLIFYNKVTNEIFVDNCQLSKFVTTDSKNDLTKQLLRLKSLPETEELRRYYLNFFQSIELQDDFDITGIRDFGEKKIYKTTYFYYLGPITTKEQNQILINKASIIICPQLENIFPDGLTIQKAVDYIEQKEGTPSIYLIAQGYEGLVFYDNEKDEVFIDESQLDTLVGLSQIKGLRLIESNDENITKQVIRLIDTKTNREQLFAYIEVLLGYDLTPSLYFNLRCTRANLMRLAGKYAEALIEYKNIEEYPKMVFSEEDMINLSKERVNIQSNHPDKVSILDWDLGILYHELGYCNYMLNNNQEALDYFSLSLVEREKQSTSLDMAKTLAYHGSIYYDEGDYEEAVKFLIKSIELMDNKEDYPSKMIIIKNLVTTLLKQQNLEEAQKYADQAFEINLLIDDNRSNAELNEINGVISRYIGNFSKSKDYYENALTFLEKLNDESRIINAYFELFLFSLLYEDESAAIAYLEKMQNLAKTSQTWGKRALIDSKLLTARLYIHQKTVEKVELATEILFETINQPEIRPTKHMFAYLNLLVGKLILFNSTQNPKHINDLKDLLHEIDHFSIRFNMISILGIVYWVQFKVCLIEEKIEKAMEWHNKAMEHSENYPRSSPNTYWIADLTQTINTFEIDQVEALEQIGKVVLDEILIRNYVFDAVRVV